MYNYFELYLLPLCHKKGQNMAQKMILRDGRIMLGKMLKTNAAAQRRENQDFKSILPGPKTFLANLLVGKTQGNEQCLVGYARILLAKS